MNAETQKIKLTLPASAEFVDIVRLNLYGIASKMGFSYEEIEDMKVAVSEACNNSVLYAYSQADGVVEVNFEVAEDVLTIIVEDQGKSFEGIQNKTPNTMHDKELHELEVGGLGFYLMQALMDDVQVDSTDGKGTKVVLTKRLMRSEERV